MKVLQVCLEMAPFSFNHPVPCFSMQGLGELAQHYVFTWILNILFHVRPVILPEPVIAEGQQEYDGKETKGSIHLQLGCLQRLFKKTVQGQLV